MGMHRNWKGWPRGFPMEAMMAAGRGWDGRFSWDDGNFRGGPRGRSGNRSRMFASGELRLLLLRMIADEPRHGYELIKAIGELTGGTYEPSPGAVYPTLSLLADEGVIAETAGVDDSARKAFEVTEAGRKELGERVDEADALMARLAAMSGKEERGRAPELFRAMGNLAGVLKHRYRDGRFDSKTIEEIVDIIDEAAKRIERL
ncbi:PadR family transcriptional regulator [Allopontixanthobacter sp.]|uniref:PadR family transcriptional regulator n=1 Tax=Allopontixanthobacter sp. TaxID=2906452 RepID=UPI002AB8A899|nr:PadR family transcriptional regulator [Allopontixanthobacter sp.]MDZ4307828.1 PadR family transcriptional regulator [Allopontixanthobacter sp.]